MLQIIIDKKKGWINPFIPIYSAKRYFVIYLKPRVERDVVYV